MARPANPTPRWDVTRKCWRVRVTRIVNGPQELHDLPGIAENEPDIARTVAKRVSDRLRRGEGAPAGEGETCGDYVVRWLLARKAAGIRTTSDDKGRWNKWIAPHLGAKAIAAVTPRDLELLVSSLDKDVRAGRLAWKTAIHTWGLVTKLFDDAKRSKDLGLRVRTDNPAVDVRGPDRGHERASAFLFPSELGKLLTRETVPLARRRLYTLAVYLGCRAGELRALEWDDVHEDEGFVLVHRSLDIRKNETKTTKTGTTRRIPIEPELLPLLQAMREESGGKGKVLSAWNAQHLPRSLRADLEESGCKRADLTADDETRRPLDFHDLRHTYGTWRAIRGDDIIKIRFAMGHTDLTTTQRYINEAHVFGGAAFGVPFGPLPPGVVSFSQVLGFQLKRPQKHREIRGGAGNRTRVRKRLAPASTCVADELHRAGLRPSAGSLRR